MDRKHSDLEEPHGERTEWEGLMLVVERRQSHWRLFVYDAERCEVLHIDEQPTAEAAKCVALEFAVRHLYGPGSDLKPEVQAVMVEWESY